MKAIFLEESGQTPRTYSIRQLLALIGQLYNKEITYDGKKLFLLESAYFNARYIAVTYDLEQATEVMQIAKKLIDYVRDLRTR